MSIENTRSDSPTLPEGYSSNFPSPSLETHPKFSKVKKRKEIEIDGEVYWIEEMMGTEIGTWRMEMNRRVAQDGKRVTNFMGIEAELISRCLIGPDGRKVAKSIVDTWPTTMIEGIFKLCQDLNGLTDEAEKREKNS